MDLKKYIRSIPDYPKKGILFRDITTLIKDENAFKGCTHPYRVVYLLRNQLFKPYLIHPCPPCFL